MIEFRVKKPWTEAGHKWQQIKARTEAPAHVTLFHMRINGVVYTEYSEEFITAYNKELIDKAKSRSFFPFFIVILFLSSLAILAIQKKYVEAEKSFKLFRML